MQEIKSKKNNKMKIAIIVLSVALVVAIGAVFGVYAATQQNVTTSFSVGYTIGDNVAVAIGAKSVALGSDGYTPDHANAKWFAVSRKGDTGTETPNENNLTEIFAQSLQNEYVLSLEDITFSGLTHYLCFYFENLSNEKAMIVTFANSIVADNMSVTPFWGVVPSTEVMDSADTMPLTSSQFAVAPGNIVCMFLSMSPIDQNKSATFETTDTTGISFTIEQP